MILKENNIRKKKALLCTYNLNNYVLVRYRELLSEYEIIGIDIPGVLLLIFLVFCHMKFHKQLNQIM